MDAADEGHRTVVEINNRGLVLVRDGTGMWWIHGAADGLVYAAEDRLAWMLPLLERDPAEVVAAFPDLPGQRTPLPALLRFALTGWGRYWPSLALGWLESGWPIGDFVEVLTEMKDSRKLSPSLRHRALALWRSAARG